MSSKIATNLQSFLLPQNFLLQSRWSWIRLIVWGSLGALANPAGLPSIAPFLFLISLTGLLRERSFGCSHWKTLLWGTGLGAGQLAWMATPTYVGTWCLFAAPLLALGIGVQWLLWGKFLPKSPSITSAIAFGALWAVLEYSREWWLFCGLGFGCLSSACTEFSLLRQLANLFGHYGLSWWLVSVALLFWFHHKRIFTWFWAAFPWGYGLSFLFLIMPSQSIPIWLTAIQTGRFPISNPGDSASRFIELHNLLSKVQVPKNFEGVRLLALPETTLRFDVDTPIGDGTSAFTIDEYYASWAKKLESHLVVGIDWTDSMGYRTGQSLYSPDGQKSRYAKRKLVIGAEFVPFSSMKSLLVPFGISDSVVAGTSLPVWRCSGYSIAPSVCYESAFAGCTRSALAPDTMLIVSSVNDGWYDDSGLTRHHASVSQLRAIETGTPLLQCGHTGWTGCWNAFGEKLCSAKKEGGRAEIVSYQGQIDRYPTPWKIWGEVGFLCAVITALLAAFLEGFQPVIQKLLPLVDRLRIDVNSIP